MVRPCVARGSSIWWYAVLHQCIRSLVGAVLLRTIMDISARATSLTERTGLDGPSGSPVFACAGKTEPPSRLILSQDSAGKGINYVIDSLLALRCSFVRAWRPFLRPDLRLQRCAARRTVKVGRRACLASRAGVARPRLDGPEHGAKDQAGRYAASLVLTHSKAHPLWRTAQAMRASLLTSAIASTLWCRRFLAASIHDLSP